MSLGTPSIPLNRKMTERTASGAWAAGVLKNEEIGPETRATMAARTTPIRALAVIAEDTWRRVTTCRRTRAGPKPTPLKRSPRLIVRVQIAMTPNTFGSSSRVRAIVTSMRVTCWTSWLNSPQRTPVATRDLSAGGWEGAWCPPRPGRARSSRAQRTRNQSKTPVIAVVEPSCDVRTPARPCGENHWKMFAGVKAVPSGVKAPLELIR